MDAPSPGPTPSGAGGNPPPKEAVSPWQETVRLSPVPAARSGSEPAIPDEAANAPVTSRFGKFIRTRRLGAGGMGEVWKAWDTVLGRWVALKFLKGGDDEEIARFRREAQTAGRLHHPNIAAIYEVNEDQGRQYIAMQFVDGQNLHQFGRGDRRLLVRLIGDAARALQYAHEQGVIHRDLKPENLMVTARGQEHHVFLMDFGLARAAEGASKISATGFLVGTPMYMAPEQARGEKVDVRSDVYSLGLTLYELLTDRKPFESESVYETLRKVQEEEPAAPRQVDRRIAPDLETVVLKSISKEPASRYASAQEFADDLRAYLAGDPIRGKRESLSRKISRRIRRHPVAFAAAAVLVVGLAASGVIATRASRDRRATKLTTSIEEAFKTRDWTEERLGDVQRQLEELARVAPEEAGPLRVRLPQVVAEALRSADPTRARDQLPVLRRLAPSEADKVEAELRQREGIWKSVFKLEAPFAEAASVFEPGAAKPEGGLLRGGAPGVQLLRRAAGGNVELKAQFEEWKGASQLGLVLNGSKQSGYRFVIATASGPAAPPFSAVHAAHGTFSLQLFRGEALLREEFVFSAQIDPDQPLRLLARREGDRLLLQANELKPVEFRDPFAMSVGQRGSFGVIWPSGVVIRRLLGGQQGLAAEPSPLDVGDDLFLQGKVEEALDRYGEAAQASPRADLRQEALYKQGLCDLRLNREEAARRIFEGLGAGFVGASKGSDTRWAFLADCQLLVLYFREKGGLDKATLLLEKLAGYGYTFDTFALLMPPDVQREVLNNVHIGSVGGNLHLRPEELIARSEFAIRASELLEPPGPHTEWKYHSLMRAYMSVGRNSDAYKTADKAFRSGRYGGEVLDSYCWVLRTEGKYEQALEKLDRALADDPTHYVERARIHAAMKQWDAALADVDAYLAKPADYLSFSSACLIKGFVLEQKGAPPAQAEDAWRRGLARNWKPTEKERGTDLYIPGRAPAGMPMLNNWIMASLLDDLPDADAEQLLGGLLAFAGKDNPVFNKMMRPSMLRATWRSPRGRDMARRQAFRDQPFSEALRVPLFLGWIAFIREICFDPTVPFSDEQDEVIWRMSTVIYEAYRNGVLTERYFLPFAAIVQGNPNSPGMGWREVAVLLEKLPELRGPLAYVFGARYVKKGDPKTALLFYRSALADAARDPAQPLLQRLAQAEIDRLSAK